MRRETNVRSASTDLIHWEGSQSSVFGGQLGNIYHSSEFFLWKQSNLKNQTCDNIDICINVINDSKQEETSKCIKAVIILQLLIGANRIL